PALPPSSYATSSVALRTCLCAAIALAAGFEVMRVTGIVEYEKSRLVLVGFDVGRSDHLAPLVCFLGNELAEVGGRAGKHGAARIGNPRPHLGIGEAGVDLDVELVDDLERRVLGRAQAIKSARLVARHEFAHGRNAR